MQALLPGAPALGWAASRVSGQQKACSGVWGTETQGSKQLLLWHEGPKGTPIRRVAQAARTWRWVCWRCGTPGGPVQGPGRLHSHLQEFSVTGGVWFNVSLCSFRWQLPCRSWWKWGHKEVLGDALSIPPPCHFPTIPSFCSLTPQLLLGVPVWKPCCGKASTPRGVWRECWSIFGESQKE